MKWLFLDVILADTNGDKRLTDADKDADKKVVAIADANGSHYIEVWLGIDTVFGKTCIDGEELLVVYSAESKNLVWEIDILSRKITTTTDLPRLGPSGLITPNVDQTAPMRAPPPGGRLHA